MTDRLSKNPEDTDVDSRLREALTDDLPDEVGRRLERRFDLELERRRTDAGAASPLLRFLSGLFASLQREPVPSRLAVPAALALLVSGVFLQAGGPGSAFAGPVSRLNAVASVSRAIQVAGPVLCAGQPGAEGLSPEALSRRVYREWAFVEVETGGGTGARLVFRALDEPSLYELEVEPGSYRPRRLRRIDAAFERGRTGAVEECEWPSSPETVRAFDPGRTK